MNHWQEPERILRRILAPERSERRAAIAVVVRTEGSAYRRPGAKLFIAVRSGRAPTHLREKTEAVHA